MPNAVILAAGQGRRLAPLTDRKPKCLVPVAGTSVLDWQLLALAEAGVSRATVVTGFGADQVEAAVKLSRAPIETRVRHNPFYALADNIGSVWAARDLLEADTLLINGDTLFDPRIARSLLEAPAAPVTVAIDRKPAYDADDMKVRVADARLRRIGKTLAGEADGEAIGMLRLDAEGAARFVAETERLLRDPDALGLWYLSVVDRLAEVEAVRVHAIAGLPWAEIDFPRDLALAAERLSAFAWRAAPGVEPAERGAR